MSGGIPSQISLDDAVVAQDEMGRPFIIVREYDLAFDETNDFSAKDARRGIVHVFFTPRAYYIC